MVVVDMLFSIFLAFVFSLLLVCVFGRRGPGPLSGFVFFFLLLFLAIWAGSVWVSPVGPMLWGTSWLVFVIVGLIFALILAALIPMDVAPPPHPAEDAEGAPSVRPAESPALAVGILFWVLLFILLGVIIARYTVLAG